jgi:hypothetical protein
MRHRKIAKKKTKNNISYGFPNTYFWTLWPYTCYLVFLQTDWCLVQHKCIHTTCSESYPNIHIIEFPKEIFVIEVIKKLMDIDPLNRIIWILGTNPSLCSLLLAQRSSLNGQPLPRMIILCYNTEGLTMSLLLCFEHYFIHDSRRHDQ